MVLFFATLFVALVAVFGAFLMFSRPENIERPFMVGVITMVTSGLAGWLLWLQSHQYNGASAGGSFAFCLLAVAGFAIGRAIDAAMGARSISADERQATLGADLAD